MATKTAKAKRQLSDIDFTKESAHIALVHKAQSGPANGHAYALILKAKQDPEGWLQKMQEVQVTMQLPEFLRRMFDMYYSEAEMLARFLGYVEPEGDEDPETYEDYMDSKLANFTILKAAEADGKLIEALAGLTDKQRFELVKAQAELETIFNAKPEGLTDGEYLEKSMIKDDAAKTALVDLQKSFDAQKVDLEKANTALADMKVELTKATEAVAAFEKAAADAKVEVRKAALVEVAGEEKAVDLIKALADASDESFTVVVDSLKASKAALEKSALFTEQGTTTDDKETKKESGVARLLKAQTAKKAD